MLNIIDENPFESCQQKKINLTPNTTLDQWKIAEKLEFEDHLAAHVCITPIKRKTIYDEWWYSACIGVCMKKRNVTHISHFYTTVT